MSKEVGASLLKAKAYAYRIVSYRAYTKEQIIEKLKNKGFNSSLREQVVKELTKYNYLNDTEFAKAWIKTRMQLKPKGERVLKLELLAKGVPKEIINQVLGEGLKNYDQKQIALDLAQQRLARSHLDCSIKTRRRIFSFLQRRGFSSEIISKTLRQLFKDDVY